MYSFYYTLQHINELSGTQLIIANTIMIIVIILGIIALGVLTYKAIKMK